MVGSIAKQSFFPLRVFIGNSYTDLRNHEESRDESITAHANSSFRIADLHF